MSRVGKKAIPIPSGVKVQLNGRQINVEGPKGKLSIQIHPKMEVTIRENEITIARKTDEKKERSLHGLVRSLIGNMVEGVSKEFTKQLQIEGIGFKAQVQGQVLQLSLGFSHPVRFDIPAGVKVEVPKPTQITIHGIDRALVGQVTANIRNFFKPEPYKGKGIRFVGESVRRKQGKAVA